LLSSVYDVEHVKKAVGKWSQHSSQRKDHLKKRLSGTGLPDGFFSNQKSQLGQSLEGLRLENDDIF
jgi:hypothetical protein